MQGSLNLTGHILCSQPKCIDSFFSNSVIVIAKHTNEGSWGLMVNKPHDHITVSDVMSSSGIKYPHDTNPIYKGGPVEPHRVHVIHTLDWKSANTIAVTPDMGITGDISVLAAIAGGQGPELYRIVAGFCAWGAHQLDGEYKGLPPWKLEHRWLDAPANIESVFNQNGEDQWRKSIDIVANSVISTWF
jgi:putative transcriptional regulator